MISAFYGGLFIFIATAGRKRQKTGQGEINELINRGERGHGSGRRLNPVMSTIPSVIVDLHVGSRLLYAISLANTKRSGCRFPKLYIGQAFTDEGIHYEVSHSLDEAFTAASLQSPFARRTS